MTLKIGLAPMEGVTELATRLWFALTSAPLYMTTPFLRVTPGFPYKRIEPSFCPEIFKPNMLSLPYQLVPQLMASDAHEALRIIEPLLEHAPFVELNCGCPAPKVVGHGAGSGLLTTTTIFNGFVEPLMARFPNRIAIKMRLGLARDDEFLPLFDVVKQFPLARLTIHGRTRENRYTGKSRWWPMEHAAKNASFPVVGSGDVNGIESFQNATEAAPSLDGLIVGRGALRNPWVFLEIKNGQPVRMSIETIHQALLCYAILQELAFLKPDALIECVGHEMFKTPCLESLDRWHVAAGFLKSQIHQHLGEQHVLTRGTLARLKMLWNYMRSSLPAQFFEPTLFRISQTDAFFEAIRTLAKSCDINDVTLMHRQEMDWVYAGEK